MAAVRGWVCVALTAIIFPGIVRGDEDRAIAAYSDGVHAYFNGQLADANNLLTTAIDEKTPDPRPYFFRGIVRHLMGESDLARNDFEFGAKAELTPKGRSFDVNDALERVQGEVRMEIEQIRRAAVADAKMQAEQASRARRNRANRNAAPLDPQKLPDVSQIVDATVPFAEISAKPYYAPVKTADQIVPAKLPMPQITPVQGQAVKPADDPFNTGDTTAPTKPLPEEMPPGDQPPPADDPFDSKDDGGNPPATDQPADETPPPAEEKKPDSADDDPFGGG